ncbi:MAG TPA: 3-deoxy-manno-octulosonate cytidylyltransferase [Nitrospiraceae bacterium]|jgi:3-deoxy-manno-octulosonate cytidylyltransferase (CMP-KDO synthetase)|nr:3-deoxy-manno-octulosonate cytidylyltransferase [Nitrospiraceae bacterium]
MRRPAGSVTVVIPARFGSSRFPGKPLARLLGKPVIQHVYERARTCRAVDEVIVATDDDRIRETVEAFGGLVVMAKDPFRTGTDRVAAVARQRTGEYFVDLQGDEIPLHSDLLADLVEPFLASGAEMGTLKRQLESADDLRNPTVVKVVTDAGGDALYFSRAPIPHVRDETDGQPARGLHYMHLGLYIYTRRTLLKLAELPTGLMEDAEKLEQLRALEHGIRIRVWETQHPSLRIDTPEDLLKAETMLRHGEAARCGDRS